MPPHHEPGLVIRVSRGSGSGPTRLAAFDAALIAAGLQGFNLVRLSSVIPAATEIREVEGDDQIDGDHGDVAYCVYAEASASTPGDQAWAGVAWAQRTDGSGAGLFVEQSGSSRDVVHRDLISTLDAMSRARTDDYEVTGVVMSSAQCQDHPVSTVVVATYRTAGWGTVTALTGGIHG